MCKLRRWRAFVSTLALLGGAACPTAGAYESDVHYGLTKWLAVQAGFSDWQSEAIATGNFRVDSGLMSTLSVVLEYACFARDPSVAERVQQRHYPSAQVVPSPRERRTVAPGSEAARQQLHRALAGAVGREAQYLGLFGAAIHPLQDSWSHAGAPSAVGATLGCDPQLAGGPPTVAGGNPHAAGHTYRSPKPTLAMAQATYEALTQYPPVQGQRRTPRLWSELIEDVNRFSAASSKTAKRQWFVTRGVEGTDFLEATSLPDGPEPGRLQFDGRQLPPLPAVASLQHDAPVEVRAFFDQAITRWAGDSPVESLINIIEDHDDTRVTRADKSGRSRAAQLVARLKLWKMRDHGSAAQLVHLARPFTATELLRVDALARRPGAYIKVPPEQALFPLTALGPHASPLLPYIVRKLPPVAGKPARVIAILRLKHAPYDTLGWIAEQSGSGWSLKEIVSVPDQ